MPTFTVRRRRPIRVSSTPTRPEQANGDRTHKGPAACVQHAHDPGSSRARADLDGRGDNDTPGPLVNRRKWVPVAADSHTTEDGTGVRIEHIHARTADAG